MKKISLLILVSLLTLGAIAQNKISGTVMDKDAGNPLSGATVNLLLQADSTTANTTVTDAAGKFSFANVANDSFIVTVNFLDFQQYVNFLKINNESKDLGTMEMVRQGKDLQAVVIVAKPPSVTQKGDTSQFSASQYKVNPDATVEDLIKKMPGITVAKDGSVTAQGETVKKVTIDGKDFFGDDASAALKNLPSEVVDKIQVFDRLSDQAQLTGVDDGNSVKAINVVTKTGVKNGQFGRVYAGFGTNDHYQAGGNMSFFSGDRRVSFVGNFNNINQQNFGSQDLLGITSGGGGRGGGRWGGGGDFMVGQSPGFSRTNAFGVNYSDKWGEKTSVTGSYFFNNNRNTNNSTSTTQLLKTNLFTTDESSSITNNFNHRLNLRVEMKLDSNNTIYIIPSLNFQNNDSRSFGSERSWYPTADSVNSSIGNYLNDRRGYNLRNNIMYRHQFAKKGRSFSLGFNTTLNENNGQSTSDVLYRTWLENGEVNDSTLNQLSDNQSDGTQYEFRVNYTEPLGENSVLQFEYEPEIEKNKSDQQTFRYDGSKYTLFDTSLSNRFDNTVTTHEGGLSYRWSKGRDAMIMAGADLQTARLESNRQFPVVATVDQRFNSILPRVMLRKKFGQYSNVHLFYRGRTDNPSVSQLQDVINISNPLSPNSGNPFLKQAYQQFLSTRYSYTNTKTNRSLFVNVFGQTVSNYISNATYVLQADSTMPSGIVLSRGARLSKPVNLDGYQSVRSFVTYSMPVNFIKSNLNMNAGYNYSRLPGLVNSANTTTLNNVFSGGIGLGSNISEYIDFNVSYNANFNNARTKTENDPEEIENNYVNQVANLTLNLLSKSGWFLQNDVTNQTYSGLSDGFNQTYWLWNAAVGKKFLKNKVGELKLSVFDLLKQNQSIFRTIGDTYIEDSQSAVLQQYFMMTFTYSLRNFGKGKSSSGSDDGPGGWRPGPGGPPPGGGRPGGGGF